MISSASITISRSWRNYRGGVSGYLSGGEGQMLVIGRAMMAHPQILMLDEPSLGSGADAGA